LKLQVFKYLLCTFVAALTIVGSCKARGTKKNDAVIFGDSTYFRNVPAQPNEDTWKFIEDLKSPLWTKHIWNKVDAGLQMADLSNGIELKWGFPGTKRRLESAYKDLQAFLAAGDVSCDNGKYVPVLRTHARRTCMAAPAKTC
jgi:multimeric flavodoxin WrbA